jgi:anti-sigma factor RsiW
MNHDESLQLIEAYHDGELDLATSLKLEEHLASCPTCQEKLKGQKELTNLIQAELPQYRPSPFLATRIRANLKDEQQSPFQRQLATFYHYLLAPSLFGFVIGAFLVFAALDAIPSMPNSNLPLDAVNDHIRSLQVNHLMDVVSTDQHTVKPWFAGKLDYSPPVIDLTSLGYPLIGGRLDYLDHRYVAAIVYQRRKHYINLFIWPSNEKLLNPRLFDVTTYHTMGWTRSGMNYMAVSELGEKELQDFVGMIQAQTAESRPGE